MADKTRKREGRVHACIRNTEGFIVVVHMKRAMKNAVFPGVAQLVRRYRYG